MRKESKMREIKFRVWHKPSKRMIWWNSLKNFLFNDYEYMRLTPSLGGGPLPDLEAPIVEYRLGKPWNFFEDTNCDVMQHTGLKDKNDKEIYEGDILAISADAEEYIAGYVHREPGCEIGEVVFCAGRYGFQTADSAFHDFEDLCEANNELTDSEIIGNIYENPELMEEGKHV
jgi:uncharacterized phage protein (TIGR01671 family)